MEQNLNHNVNPDAMNAVPYGEGDTANNTASNSSSFLLEHPIQSAYLQPDNYIMVDHIPCQVLEIPKVTLKARNIYTGEVLAVNCSATTKFDVPKISTEYYEALRLSDDGNLTIKKFDGDNSTVRNIRIHDHKLLDSLRMNIGKPNHDTYCTIIKAFGTEILASVKSCPSLSDFHRLPNEMLVKLFSYLPIRDVLPVRLVCRAWESIVPISSLINIHLMKISRGRITIRMEPVTGRCPIVGNRWKAGAPSNLSEFGPGLINTLRHLELRERVPSDDLVTILEHCTQLASIDLDYPTHETMQVLDNLISNNEESLSSFSIWDYFWYNSEKDAFDCASLTTCRLQALNLFVKNIKNLECIPLSIRYLKLDQINVDQIRWIAKNMKNLKSLRLEVEHSHYGDPRVVSPDEDGMMCELDEGILRDICSLPKMEKLDLHFSTVKGLGGFHVLCPTVMQFEAMCNEVVGITAFSDTWDTSCTLEISIDRNLFSEFVVVEQENL